MFTKKDTNLIKGLAVIVLCYHHLFWRTMDVPLNLSATSVNQMLTPMTKVCVAIFTILSGYGINESFKRCKNETGKFVWRHSKKLIVNFWWIYIPVVLLAFPLDVEGTPIDIYGKSAKGFGAFLLDFMGLRGVAYTASLNNTWWYVETALVLYLVFPILSWFMKKNKLITVIVACLPNIIVMIDANILLKYVYYVDRELFYIAPFAIGMYLSEVDLLNKLMTWCKGSKRVILLIVAGMLTCGQAVLATQINNPLTQSFYALSIIACMIAIIQIIPIKYKVLEILGIHSMNIFLVHSIVYYYFGITSKIVFMFPTSVLKLAVLVMLSLAISIVIEKVKKLCERRGK